MYEFPSFWNYLRTKQDEVVVVSTIQRMSILREYLKVIHRYDLPVSEISNAKLLKLEKSDYRGTLNNILIYSLHK